MKKQILVLGMSLLTTVGFAKETTETKKENSTSQVCCRRGASNSNGENATVRACVPSTGDYQIDLGKACEKAQNAANKALKALEEENNSLKKD